MSENYCPAEPISLSFGWNEVGAVAVVGVTALVLDFMAFRASELEKRTRVFQKQQNQNQQQLSLPRSSHIVNTSDDNSISPLPNAHDGAATSHDCTDTHGPKGVDSHVDGGDEATCGDKGSGVVGVEVRPAEAEGAASAEYRGRVQMRRVFVLAGWIACAVGFHRCGRRGWELNWLLRSRFL